MSKKRILLNVRLMPDADGEVAVDVAGVEEDAADGASDPWTSKKLIWSNVKPMLDADGEVAADADGEAAVDVAGVEEDAADGASDQWMSNTTEIKKPFKIFVLFYTKSDLIKNLLTEIWHGEGKI